jgi:hypothetical protein
MGMSAKVFFDTTVRVVESDNESERRSITVKVFGGVSGEATVGPRRDRRFSFK